MHVGRTHGIARPYGLDRGLRDLRGSARRLPSPDRSSGVVHQKAVPAAIGDIVRPSRWRRSTALPRARLQDRLLRARSRREDDHARAHPRDGEARAPRQAGEPGHARRPHALLRFPARAPAASARHERAPPALHRPGPGVFQRHPQAGAHRRRRRRLRQRLADRRAPTPTWRASRTCATTSPIRGAIWPRCRSSSSTTSATCLICSPSRSSTAC